MKNVWWNYINGYRFCLQEKLLKKTIQTLDCYEELLDKLSIGNDLQDRLKFCIDDSFVDKDDYYGKDNKLLKLDMNSAKYGGIYLVPAIFLNRNLVKEELLVSITVSAICEKLLIQPDYCVAQIEGVDFLKPNQNINGLLIFFSMLTVGVLILFMIVIIVKRKMRRNIGEEVSTEI